MSKYVLVTAGNTSEAIDSVRSITNTASGKLGSIIADVFISRGVDVIYVCGMNSALPMLVPVETIRIVGVNDLLQTVNALSENYSFDCIIHSMAVSDYTVKGIIPYEDLSDAILQNTEATFSTKSGKLSSDLSNPVILLEKAPKVISELKNLYPNALLVGFKLLVDAKEEELYSVAMKLMKKNRCDFVCANDLKHISPRKHEALIIEKDGQYSKAFTKPEIAHAIIDKIFRIWEDQQ